MTRPVWAHCRRRTMTSTPQPEQQPSREPQSSLEPVEPAWAIGAAVCLQHTPSYLKTADPMPMLRPPDLVDLNEVGTVVGQRSMGQLAVRFRRGTFLIAAAALVAAPDGQPASP
ncbi:NAD(P)H dehydrogenase assembly family protein [Cyanobium sp. LEGE 06143]|uniref:NAD(P)H dehydrogenase assembly family protein n=1 Tax=Cyanobium sp. LEGE 06143 TaxID=945727 RepID=UPI00351BF183